MKKQLNTFAGSHIGDAIRTANIFNWEANPTIGGTPYLVAASSEAGVLTTSPGLMKFIPRTEPGIANGANASLVTQNTFAQGGSLPIRGLPTGTPATGYFLDFVKTFPMIRLDNPRNILLGVMGTGGAPSTAFNFSVSGADIYGQLLTATQVVPAGLAVTTLYELPKSFAYVKSMNITAATGAPIWVGVGKSFGMDYYTPSTGMLTRVTYNNISLSISADNNSVFIAPPALDAAPTATSADVRGAIAIPTATAITGTAELIVQYIIQGGSSQLSWTYTPTTNKWTATPNDTMVLNTLGAPQFYNASLA